MPATKTRPVPQRIRDAHRQMKRESLAKWRRWAESIANSRDDLPDPIELLSVGTLLSIPAPADALESDAQAIRDAAHAEAAIERCVADAAKLVSPWGDRQKLLNAAEAAEAEARRLRDVLSRVDDECNSGHWRMQVGMVRNRHPRAFSEHAERLVLQGEESNDGD